MNTPSRPIIAVIYEYTDPVDLLLSRLASAMSVRGLQLAGIVQRDEPRADRDKCDMILQDLSSGERIRISEDRGRHAKGCRLNVDWLLSAANSVLAALETRPDLLIINKFGKVEAEGGGLRHLIVRALEIGVPVLVAVPARNLDSWRIFAGDTALELPFVQAEARFDDLTRHLQSERAAPPAEFDRGTAGARHGSHWVVEPD